MRGRIGLDRAERRLLGLLNCGWTERADVLNGRMTRLKETGLVQENQYGEITITARGQLELARSRFRKLPKPKISVMTYKPPRPGLWLRLRYLASRYN